MSNKVSGKIAVLIKTCKGRPSVLWTIHSVTQSLRNQNFRIYIADDIELDDWKIPLYESLKKGGHCIIQIDNALGVGVARNRLLDQLEDEDFILRMDDDFELGGEFNIVALLTVLNASDSIEFCSDYERQFGHAHNRRSGTIRPAGGDIIHTPPKIIKKYHSPLRRYLVHSGIRYSYAEHTRNLLLIKRRVFEKIRWEEGLLFMGEHLDFMLTLKNAGFKGAYTPDSIHYHREDLVNIRYEAPESQGANEFRPGEHERLEVYRRKWNSDQTLTRYPLTWYFIEAGRRLFSSMVEFKSKY